MKTKLVALSLVAVAIVFAFVTPVVGNLYSLLTGRGYVIPHESSIFTFHETQGSDGSGEWWAYGEDGTNFYAASDREGARYLLFPRAKARECAGFRPHDSSTWCASMTKAVK